MHIAFAAKPAARATSIEFITTSERSRLPAGIREAELSLQPNSRVLFHATAWSKSKPGAPDGMKVDRHGNIFAAGPGGVHVISPAGKHLGSIETGAPTGNVAWGEDGSTLFIASNQSIYRIRLSTRGVGF